MLHCTNRNSTGIVPGSEFIHAMLQISGGTAGEALKCPDEMRLIVIIMVNMVF